MASTAVLGVRYQDREMSHCGDMIADQNLGQIMKRIMVVDDEASVRNMLAAVLEDEGYAVVTANNGAEALRLLVDTHPDLVLMDVMMPGMSGREVSLRISEDPQIEETPVILMSAASRPVPQDKHVKAYLAKPFDIDRLLALIGQTISS